MSGIINLIVGFMALFPGMFEAGVSSTASEQENFFALLGTKYGLYAIALFVSAGVQMILGSYINLLVRARAIAIPVLSALIVVSVGLELWGYLFKSYLTVFAVPGIVAGLVCMYLVVQNIKDAA